MNALRAAIPRRTFMGIYLLLCVGPTLFYTAVYLIVPAKCNDLPLSIAGWGTIIAWPLGCLYFGLPFLYRSGLFISWIIDARGKKPKPEKISALSPEKRKASISEKQFKRRQTAWRGLVLALIFIPFPLFGTLAEHYENFWGGGDAVIACYFLAVLISHTQIE